MSCMWVMGQAQTSKRIWSTASHSLVLHLHTLPPTLHGCHVATTLVLMWLRCGCHMDVECRLSRCVVVAETAGYETTSTGLMDLDQDGDEDLVLGAWKSPDRVYLQCGGGFRCALPPSLTHSPPPPSCPLPVGSSR